MSEWTSTADDTAGVAWDGDQAAGLRRMFSGRVPQVVAFASGRESSGRTTLLMQTAEALAAGGHRVLIVDENPAPNNAISNLGLKARHDLFQVLQGTSRQPCLARGVLSLAWQKILTVHRWH